MLLYIHVPFCRKKCAYCAFYSVPLPPGAEGGALIKGYPASLLGELRLWGKRLGKTRVTTVFFGGGTPSLLPAKAVGGILDAAADVFSIDSTAEITAEANPDSALADGWLFDIKKAGVNRLSLGVQSLHDADLGLLGRPHDARAAEAAYHTARAAGFTNISLDFMWGLPGTAGRGQSSREWLRQLEQAANLQPEHLSTYGLSLEPGSPLHRACEAGELTLPKEREQAAMYIAGSDYLESRGYMQYEISNYSRLGFECRHNLGYWEGEDYLGLGPAATSTLGARRWTNPADIGRWREAVRNNSIAAEYEELSPQTRLKELLMLRLRTAKGLPLSLWKEKSGRAFAADFGPLSTALQQNGLAAVRNKRFRLTRSGMLVSDAVLAHFFEHMEAGEKREREGNSGEGEKSF